MASLSSADKYDIPSSSFLLLRDVFFSSKKKLLGFFFLSGVATLCWIASPYFVSKAITELTDEAVFSKTIWVLVFLFFLMRLCDEWLWRISELLVRSFMPQAIEQIRLNLFSAVLRRPYSFFVDASSGQIGHWVNQAVFSSKDLIRNIFWSIWGQILRLVFSAFFLFSAHWSLAIIFMVWLVALFLYTIRRGENYSKLVANDNEEVSKTAGFVVDAVSNHLSVRSFVASGYEKGRLSQQQKTVIGQWRSSWIYNTKTNMVKGNSASFVSFLAYVLVVYLYVQGQVEIGSVVLFLAYYDSASSGLWQLAWAINLLYQQKGAIDNALDGLRGEVEGSSERTLPELPETVAISLDTVSFSYPDAPSLGILKDFSLTLEKNQKVGVVGHSGAGKSTLVSLLLGFYIPTSGEIMVNGSSISGYSPEYLRLLSSYVPQETNLFNRSVRDNVLYARPDATEEELESALRGAECWEFVNNLPDKIDTVIGERGVKLSGGQRQRLAIARAMLKDAPFLILDEATSALDSVSEQAIQRALHTVMQDRTALVIAHRLSTLQHLDRILVMDKGGVAEYGNHDQLLQKDGIYANLWKRQKDGFLVPSV